jgi:hypothetical protein
MNLTVHIPDDIAARLGADAVALERRALEALIADEYRAGRLNKPDLRRLLGLETDHEIDGFLKAHDVYDAYTIADLEQELESQRRASEDRRAAADSLVDQFRAFQAGKTLGGIGIKELIAEGRR